MFLPRFCFMIAMVGLLLLAGAVLCGTVLVPLLQGWEGPTAMAVGLVLFFGGAAAERLVTPSRFLKQGEA